MDDEAANGATVRLWSLSTARILFGVLPLATGAAFLAFVLANVSLRLAVALLVVAAIGTALFARRRLLPWQRHELARRARGGVLAGAAATAAYDVVRYALVSLAQMSVTPFAAIKRFGELMIGSQSSALALYTAGTIYHVANGIGFATAYAVVVPTARLWSAVLWALVLEAFMLVLYPRWLGVNAAGEFAVMSVGGHLAFGATLGYTLIRLGVTASRDLS